MTPLFAETMELPESVDWKEQVDVLILKRITEAAMRTKDRHTKNKQVITYGEGEHVLIRVPNYKHRAKGTPLWAYEANPMGDSRAHDERQTWN